MYINEQNYMNNPLYYLLRKILRFDYVQGNKKRDSFTQLPKLEHLSTTTVFCIAIDDLNNEKIYQEYKNDISMCSKLYGCSLKMTAVIRPDNIASNEHILELLSILLEEELNKPIVELNINQIQKTQQKLNNRARFFVNPEIIPNYIRNQREQAMVSSKANTDALKQKIRNEIKRMENQKSIYNISTYKQKRSYEEAILSMKTYLQEL